MNEKYCSILLQSYLYLLSINVHTPIATALTAIMRATAAYKNISYDRTYYEVQHILMAK